MLTQVIQDAVLKDLVRAYTFNGKLTKSCGMLDFQYTYMKIEYQRIKTANYVIAFNQVLTSARW